GGAGILSGSLWSANAGWISLGDGTPANGIHYSQATREDYGVNAEASGALTGYAWSANLGWLTFTAQAGNGSPFPGPHLDWQTGRLTGFVWSANAGWMDLAASEQGGGSLPPVTSPVTWQRAPHRTVKATIPALLAHDFDPEGTALTLLEVESPTREGGRAWIEEGWVIYQAPDGFDGPDAFFYQVADAGGSLALGWVQVVVWTDNAPTPNIISLIHLGGTTRIRFAGVPGQSYRVQASESLLPPIPWHDLGSVTADAQGQFEFSDPEAGLFPIRYYRTFVP
ncbi:MAG: hypothetical protein KIT22_16670, partial [Verrucomicrobiae bacterium]|nr:hypothetical protein [Verrucomicrobiae bacterium]